MDDPTHEHHEPERLEHRHQQQRHPSDPDPAELAGGHRRDPGN
jgi:hypothetical protein